MADVKAALVEFLKADAGVQKLAGDGKGGARVYPEASPLQPALGDFPRVVLRLLRTDDERTLAGSSDQPTEVLELACQGHGPAGYADAQALAAAVRGATGGSAGGKRLLDFRGWMGVQSRVWIQGVRLEDAAAPPAEVQPPGGRQKPIHEAGLTLAVDYLRT